MDGGSSSAHASRPGTCLSAWRRISLHPPPRFTHPERPHRNHCLSNVIVQRRVRQQRWAGWVASVVAFPGFTNQRIARLWRPVAHLIGQRQVPNGGRVHKGEVPEQAPGRGREPGAAAAGPGVASKRCLWGAVDSQTGVAAAGVRFAWRSSNMTAGYDGSPVAEKAQFGVETQHCRDAGREVGLEEAIAGAAGGPSAHMQAGRCDEAKAAPATYGYCPGCPEEGPNPSHRCPKCCPAPGLQEVAGAVPSTSCRATQKCKAAGGGGGCVCSPAATVMFRR